MWRWPEVELRQVSGMVQRTPDTSCLSGSAFLLRSAPLAEVTPLKFQIP